LIVIEPELRRKMRIVYRLIWWEIRRPPTTLLCPSHPRICRATERHLSVVFIYLFVVYTSLHICHYSYFCWWHGV